VRTRESELFQVIAGHQSAILNAEAAVRRDMYAEHHESLETLRQSYGARFEKLNAMRIRADVKAQGADRHAANALSKMTALQYDVSTWRGRYEKLLVEMQNIRQIAQGIEPRSDGQGVRGENVLAVLNGYKEVFTFVMSIQYRLEEEDELSVKDLIMGRVRRWVEDRNRMVTAAIAARELEEQNMAYTDEIFFADYWDRLDQVEE